MRLIQYTISFSKHKPSLLRHVAKGAGIGAGIGAVVGAGTGLAIDAASGGTTMGLATGALATKGLIKGGIIGAANGVRTYRNAKKRYIAQKTSDKDRKKFKE